ATGSGAVGAISRPDEDRSHHSPSRWFGGRVQKDLRVAPMGRGAQWRIDSRIRVHIPPTSQSFPGVLTLLLISCAPPEAEAQTTAPTVIDPHSASSFQATGPVGIDCARGRSLRRC